MIVLRNAIRDLAPAWLRGFWGSRLLYALALPFDGFGDLSLEAVRAPFPGYTPGALSTIGRDREVVRGFNESDESYAVRCREWIDNRRTRGAPLTLLRQLRGYLTGYAVKFRLYNNTGACWTLEADGTWSYDPPLGVDPWNWDDDANSFSRFWVIIYPPADLWLPEGTWGSASSFGESGTIGTTATREQVDTIRQIVQIERPPHSSCVYIIVAFDPDSFDPANPEPDGSWGHWGKGSAPRTRARLSTARYWKGDN